MDDKKDSWVKMKSRTDSNDMGFAQTCRNDSDVAYQSIEVGLIVDVRNHSKSQTQMPVARISSKQHWRE